MNRTRRIRYNAVPTLLFLSLTSIGASFGEIDPKAEEVLRALSQKLLSAKTIQVKTLVSVKVSQGEVEKEDTTMGSLLLERPNKVSLEVIGGKVPFTLMSDGKEKTTLVPPLAGYTVEPAGEDLTGMLTGVAGNLANQQLPLTAALFAEDPYEFFTSETTGIRYEGEGTLGDILCHRLKVDQPGSGMEMWIEKGDRPLIHQVTPDTSELQTQLAAQSPGIKIEMKIAFQDWVLDEPLAEEQFAFVPPEWAEKRETFLTSAPRQDAAMELIGKEAPSLEVPLLDGTQFNLASVKGQKIVILDFWTTWCGPCVMALPILAEVAELYKDRGVVFVAVNIEGVGPAEVQSFVDRKELDINVGVDEKQLAAGSYRVGPIPQTVIVGKEGVVQTVHLGMAPNLKEKLSEELDTLLAGKDLYK